MDSVAAAATLLCVCFHSEQSKETLLPPLYYTDWLDLLRVLCVQSAAAAAPATALAAAAAGVCAELMHAGSGCCSLTGAIAQQRVVTLIRWVKMNGSTPGKRPVCDRVNVGVSVTFIEWIREWMSEWVNKRVNAWMGEWVSKWEWETERAVCTVTL